MGCVDGLMNQKRLRLLLRPGESAIARKGKLFLLTSSNRSFVIHKNVRWKPGLGLVVAGIFLF